MLPVSADNYIMAEINKIGDDQLLEIKKTLIPKILRFAEARYRYRIELFQFFRDANTDEIKSFFVDFIPVFANKKISDDFNAFLFKIIPQTTAEKDMDFWLNIIKTINQQKSSDYKFLDMLHNIFYERVFSEKNFINNALKNNEITKIPQGYFESEFLSEIIEIITPYISKGYTNCINTLARHPNISLNNTFDPHGTMLAEVHKGLSLILSIRNGLDTLKNTSCEACEYAQIEYKKSLCATKLEEFLNDFNNTNKEELSYIYEKFLPKFRDCCCVNEYLTKLLEEINDRMQKINIKETPKTITQSSQEEIQQSRKKATEINKPSTIITYPKKKGPTTIATKETLKISLTPNNKKLLERVFDKTTPHYELTYKELVALVKACGAQVKNCGGSVRKIIFPTFDAYTHEPIGKTVQNIHEPHGKQHNRGKLPRFIVRLFKNALEKAGMTPESLNKNKSKSKLVC